LQVAQDAADAIGTTKVTHQSAGTLV
jgi:hypothetical protein